LVLVTHILSTVNLFHKGYIDFHIGFYTNRVEGDFKKMKDLEGEDRISLIF